MGPGTAAGGDDGAVLFAARCAACHGADGRGADGRPDIRCHRSIREVVRAGRSGTIGVMPPAPDLTDDEVGAIQHHLRAGCRSASGPTLFATHCAHCHGDDAEGAGGGPEVRCATRVTDAIHKGRDTAMPPLSGLSQAEIELLEADLATRCRRAGRTPARVYAANCATCHGAEGAGGRDARWIEGPDIGCTAVADWNHAVLEGQGGMPAYAGLGRSMVEALRRHVHRADCDARP